MIHALYRFAVIAPGNISKAQFYGIRHSIEKNSGDSAQESSARKLLRWIFQHCYLRSPKRYRDF
jgi:hypothetical protein